MTHVLPRLGLALAGFLLAWPALAGTLPKPSVIPETGAVLVHHKPGHQGGPPWTRGRNADRGDRAYDDVPRGYASRGYDDGYGPPAAPRKSAAATTPTRARRSPAG